MSRFIKYIPDSEISQFLESKPLTNHLALIIAKRARRAKCELKGLDAGECFLGDFKAFGLSEQEYRTAKKHLEKLNFATFRTTATVTAGVTKRVTVAKLVNTDVWDINENVSNVTNNAVSNAVENAALTLNNNDKKDYKNEQEEKEREEKKALSLKNSKIEDLEKQLLESNEKIKALEAEKEKEKKVAAKKEKGAHEFPKQNSKPASNLKPPKHANDLEDAFYSAEDSANLKPYELAVQNYSFENWTETLKQAYDAFCEWEYTNSKHKFSGTQAKELIRVVEADKTTHGAERVEKCLRLCVLRRWAYDMSYQLNKEKREFEDSQPKQPKTFDKKPTYKDIPLLEGDLSHLKKY